MPRDNRILILLVIIASLLCLGAGAFFLWRPSPAPPSGPEPNWDQLLASVDLTCSQSIQSAEGAEAASPLALTISLGALRSAATDRGYTNESPSPRTRHLLRAITEYEAASTALNLFASRRSPRFLQEARDHHHAAQAEHDAFRASP